MFQPDQNRDAFPPVIAVHLLGTVDYDAALALQQRLVYEAGSRADGQISLLLCEHPACIAVGRQGSRADIRLGPRGLASRRLSVRWVNRGGGAMLHAPGQLAAYPIVPLGQRGWSVGEYLARLQRGVLAAVTELHLPCHGRPGARGVWGRTGQIAALGVAVKDWTAYHGAFLNVDVPGELLRLVHADLVDRRPMSSLFAERQQPVKMTTVREGLVRHLAAALDCPKVHLFTGHLLLAPSVRDAHESAARAG
jgi:lipoyl(octanoyl) transferase